MESDMLIKLGVGVLVEVAIYKLFGTTTVAGLNGIIIVLLVLLFTYQNKLLYMPVVPDLPLSPKDNPQGYRHPSQQGVDAQNVEIVTADHLKLRGWLATHPNTERLIVYFHQNAGNIGTRIPFIKELHKRTNSDVLLVAYRGYSDSEGQPTEEGLKLDARAVLDYAVGLKAQALSQGNVKDIYIFGRSLGGAVTIYISSQKPYKNEIKGLILENTFTSIQDMVKVLFPPLSHLGFLHRNFWPSKEIIPSLKHPMLFIRSLRDEIVPTEQMAELLNLASSASIKEQHTIKHGTHNVSWQIDLMSYFSRLNRFFKKLQDEDQQDIS